MSWRLLLLLASLLLCRESVAFVTLEDTVQNRDNRFSAEALIIKYDYRPPNGQFFSDDKIDVNARMNIVTAISQNVPLYVVAKYNEKYYMKTSNSRLN